MLDAGDLGGGYVGIDNDQCVVPFAAVEDVSAAAAAGVELVVAYPTAQGSRAATVVEQLIVAGTAVEHVAGLEVTLELVVAVATVEDVEAGTAGEQIVASSTVEQIVALIAVEVVGPCRPSAYRYRYSIDRSSAV